MVRSLIFSALLLCAAGARAEPPRARVTDDAAWARLLERARLRPTSTQRLSVGATDYEVDVVVLAARHACPAGMTARVSLYAARAVRGPGGEVYPARLTVQCAGEELTRDEAAVDAGYDGAIRDGSLYDPASDKILPLDKPRLTPAQQARLDGLLAGAVELLLREQGAGGGSKEGSPRTAAKTN